MRRCAPLPAALDRLMIFRLALWRWFDGRLGHDRRACAAARLMVNSFLAVLPLLGGLLIGGLQHNGASAAACLVVFAVAPRLTLFLPLQYFRHVGLAESIVDRS